MPEPARFAPGCRGSCAVPAASRRTRVSRRIPVTPWIAAGGSQRSSDSESNTERGSGIAVSRSSRRRWRMKPASDASPWVEKRVQSPERAANSLRRDRGVFAFANHDSNGWEPIPTRHTHGSVGPRSLCRTFPDFVTHCPPGPRASEHCQPPRLLIEARGRGVGGVEFNLNSVAADRDTICRVTPDNRCHAM